MKTNINIKRYIICIIALFICISTIILIKILIDKKIIRDEMKTAEHAITVKEDVHMYSSAKEKGRFENIKVGTDTYILNELTDKNGIIWNKVKIGEKVGYIKSENISTYNPTYKKRDIMIDVSKFNMKNNFKDIGEFKAFLINNNVKFVYIRAGGRGYGQAGNFYTDTNADEYAKACEFLKIPFGYYFLDEAISSEEVDEEVNFINEYIFNHKYNYNTLPIAIDVEKHVESGRADEIWDTRYELINELMSKLKQNQKRAILYSNANLANKYLTDVNTEMWLAYYPNVTNIPEYWYSDTNEDGASNKKLISKLVAWQFTENGIKDKINNEIDISMVYSNYLINNNMEDVENDIKEKNEMVFGPINHIRKMWNQ